MNRLGGHVVWLAGALLAVVSVVLAVVVPASWWGATFALGVAVALVGARGHVSAAYAAGWTRTIIVGTLLAVGIGVVYASATGPWGPNPSVYVPVAFLLVVAALATVADTALARCGGRLTDYQLV